MEGRTRVALGGFFTGAATVSVVAALAITNASALADTSGAPVKAEPVLVPFAATPAPALAPTAAPSVPPVVPTPVATPETVPAVEPEDVVKRSQTESADEGQDDKATKNSTEKKAAKPAKPSAKPTTPQKAEAVAPKSFDSWEEVYAWAEDHGWSKERVDAWIARLKARWADREERRDGAKNDKSSANERSFDRGHKTRSRDGTPDHRD